MPSNQEFTKPPNNQEPLGANYVSALRKVFPIHIADCWAVALMIVTIFVQGRVVEEQSTATMEISGNIAQASTGLDEYLKSKNVIRSAQLIVYTLW